MTRRAIILSLTSILILDFGCALSLLLEQSRATVKAKPVKDDPPERREPEPDPSSSVWESPEHVQSFFADFCIKCHGPAGAGDGDIDYIDDLAALVDHKLIVPGNADASLLFRRLTDPDDPMPPESSERRPSAKDVDLIRAWIDAGAPPKRSGNESVRGN